MNNGTKRASKAEYLHQRIELFSEAGTPESGQVTDRTPGWRSLVYRLTSASRLFGQTKEAVNRCRCPRDESLRIWSRFTPQGMSRFKTKQLLTKRPIGLVRWHSVPGSCQSDPTRHPPTGPQSRFLWSPTRSTQQELMRGYFAHRLLLVPLGSDMPHDARFHLAMVGAIRPLPNIAASTTR